MYQSIVGTLIFLAQVFITLAIKLFMILKTSHYISYLIQSYHRIKSRLKSWLRWRPTSPQELDAAERKVLSFVRNPYRTYYVDIGNGWGNDHNKIWTIEMSPNRSSEVQNQNQPQKMPIVLIHGFASAIGLWSLNLDSILSTDRKVYAFDILGFGKSSRPPLHASPNCEQELVSSIEKWRVKVGLTEKFILLGHSFGAYLSASYALQHPDRVSHLILADPWGMPTLEMNQQLNQHNFPRPWWVPLIAKVVTKFNPLAGLRAAGPWGPKLVNNLRSDIRRKFENVYGEGNADCFIQYIYHCNAQPNPTGEAAFKALSTGLGWARNPLIDRIGDLHNNIDITFIYGSRSWIDRQPGFQTKYILGDRVSIRVIEGSGHHVYADKHEEFNNLVAKVCDIVDFKHNTVNGSEEDEEVVPQVVQPLVD